MNEKPVVLAVGAHPDDIEFLMAGTLFLLKEKGFEIHYMNIGDGCCGSTTLSREEIAEVRVGEARKAADRLGAIWHPPIAHDLEIFYSNDLIKPMTQIIRQINPHILLIHSLNDYMEDHTVSARICRTAAFLRNVPNFLPYQKDYVSKDLTIYHAQPLGNITEMGNPVKPTIYVDITTVINKKKDMLACHESQRSWLQNKGMDEYLDSMEAAACQLGEWSGN